MVTWSEKEREKDTGGQRRIDGCREKQDMKMNGA